jgi:Protein of unknown function (DUF3108)
VKVASRLRVGRLTAALSVACAAPLAHSQAPTCPAANEWPAKMRLEYDVTASRGPFSISGESVLLFERTETSYSLTVTTDSAAIYHARQTSRGSIEPAGLRPTEYVETRGKRAPLTTTFDWNAKSVMFSAYPDASAPTQPGLQDRASLLLQLVWLERGAAGAASFEVPVAGARRIGPYRFARHGAETVRVPIGAVEAVRIERPADTDQDRLEAWFGMGWCGLPVRIRYTDRNGGTIDHRLRAARIDCRSIRRRARGLRSTSGGLRFQPRGDACRSARVSRRAGRQAAARSGAA